MFFCLGIYAKKYKLPYLFKFKYVPVVIAALLSVLEALILENVTQSYSFAATQIKISSCLYSICVINLSVHIINSNKYKCQNLLSKVGDVSYGIFYVHPICLIFVTKIMNICLYNLYLPVFSLIQMIITVIICYILILFARYVLGRNMATKILGF